jgi:glutaredoxin
MLEIVLYTKENCSLCRKARRALQELQNRFDFRLIEKDITLDPDLHERYRLDIPVATLNGEPNALATVLSERSKQ